MNNRYFSEVAIAIPNHALEGLSNNTRYWMETTCNYLSQRDGFLIIKWNHVEWNEEDLDCPPAIIEIEQALALTPNDQYGIIRIGEHDEDFEREGQPWDFGIEYVRSIEIEEG